MRWLFCSLLFGLWGCQNQQNGPASFDLSVVYATALREAPGEKNPELLQLQTGIPVRSLGKVSDFVSGIRLDDTLRQEPWIMVQTRDGRQGWVFAGALRPRDTDAATARQWQLGNRFKAWFGPVLSQRWEKWVHTPPVATDTAFAIYIRQGLALRDTINQLISRRVTRDPNLALPDLFWLGEMSPLFIVQQISHGTSYYLFVDYRYVAATAARTTGSEDDTFVQVGLEAFPADSLESALPVWVFPLSEEQRCSNLGKGKHLQLLKAIDRASKAGELFQPELSAFKDQILADILDQTVFWQPPVRILEELNHILGAGLNCLNSRDRLALEARRNMFKTPGENGIQVNVRSGD